MIWNPSTARLHHFEHRVHNLIHYAFSRWCSISDVEGDQRCQFEAINYTFVAAAAVHGQVRIGRWREDVRTVAFQFTKWERRHIDLDTINTRKCLKSSLMCTQGIGAADQQCDHLKWLELVIQLFCPSHGLLPCTSVHHIRVSPWNYSFQRMLLSHAFQSPRIQQFCSISDWISRAPKLELFCTFCSQGRELPSCIPQKSLVDQSVQSCDE